MNQHFPTAGPLYCETLHAQTSWIAEPVNFVTNGVIVLAAIVGYWLARRQQVTDWKVTVLVVLLAANGIGSALWHGTRQVWTLPVDFLPAAFFFLFLLYAWFSELKQSRFWGYGAVLGFFGMFYASSFVSQIWLGSYALPTFVALGVSIAVLAILYIGVTYTYNKQAATWAGLATLGFFAAIFFRTIDLPVCDYTFGIGTHFMWHVCNSLAALAGIQLVVSLIKKNKV